MSLRARRWAMIAAAPGALLAPIVVGAGGCSWIEDLSGYHVREAIADAAPGDATPRMDDDASSVAPPAIDDAGVTPPEDAAAPPPPLPPPPPLDAGSDAGPSMPGDPPDAARDPTHPSSIPDAGPRGPCELVARETMGGGALDGQPVGAWSIDGHAVTAIAETAGAITLVRDDGEPSVRWAGELGAIRPGRGAIGAVPILAWTDDARRLWVGSVGAGWPPSTETIELGDDGGRVPDDVAPIAVGTVRAAAVLRSDGVTIVRGGREERVLGASRMLVSVTLADRTMLVAAGADGEVVTRSLVERDGALALAASFPILRGVSGGLTATPTLDGSSVIVAGARADGTIAVGRAELDGSPSEFDGSLPLDATEVALGLDGEGNVDVAVANGASLAVHALDDGRLLAASTLDAPVRALVASGGAAMELAVSTAGGFERRRMVCPDGGASVEP